MTRKHINKIISALILAAITLTQISCAQTIGTAAETTADEVTAEITNETETNTAMSNINIADNDKSYNTFNIVDYGAVGDGKTNCTEAVQNALDDAAECSGVVIVPPGTYMVGSLKVGKGVSIEGTPAWSFRNYGSSVFRLCDSKADCMLDITGAVGCRIYGMSLDGADLGSKVHGIKLHWDKSNGGGTEDTPTVDECRIGNFTGDGLHFNNIWCFSVRHSMICFNGGAGLYLNGWDAFILDNWFSANKGGGINGGYYSASLTVTGNRVEWNSSFGFSFPKGDNFNITGNFFDRTYGPALILGAAGSGVNTATVTGNVLRYNGSSGANKYSNAHIVLQNSTNLVVSGNSMLKGTTGNSNGVNTPDYGIVANNVTYSVIKDNAMHNSAQVEEIDLNGENTGSIIKDNITD